MRLTLLCCVLLCFLCTVNAAKKKPKSEYTQKDWDRVAREWEREEAEQEEKERQEAYKSAKQGLKFDPNGSLNPETLMAQAKKGKPTMVFLTVKAAYAKSQKELTTYTQQWASLLLNGNIPVQTFPVAENRAIFMVQEGSLSYQIKDFLLKQKEIESVSIDQQEWKHDAGGVPNYPGQKPDKKKKPAVKNGTEKKPELKKEGKEAQPNHQVHNTLDPEDNLTEDELEKKLFKGKPSKSPRPSRESNKAHVRQSSLSDNDIRSEL